MHKNLSRIVAIGREKFFPFDKDAFYVFNGAINTKLYELDFHIWQITKRNSPFLTNGAKSGAGDFNNNIFVTFKYNDISYANELFVEAAGEFFLNGDTTVILKNRSNKNVIVSNLEFEVWSLIQGQTNLFRLHSFLKEKYGEDTANKALFYSIPNMQSSELCDLFKEPSFILA